MSKSVLYRIVPDKTIERIRFLGRVDSDSCWEIGQTAIDVWSALQDYKAQLMMGAVKLSPEDTESVFNLGEMDVYDWVGENFGRSGRTIRYYVRVVAKIPPDVRGIYDVLPFSHFEFALELGESYRDVLSASLRQMDCNNGRPPSVDWLRANFQGISQVQRDCAQIDFMNEISSGAAQVWEGVDDSVVEQPPEPGQQSRDRFALRVIAQAVRPLEQFVNSRELPEPVTKALQALVEALRNALYEPTKH